MNRLGIAVQRSLTSLALGLRLTVMDTGGVMFDARMAVLGVVPSEERLAVGAGVRHATEPHREVGRYFIVLNCDSEYGLRPIRRAISRPPVVGPEQSDLFTLRER